MTVLPAAFFRTARRSLLLCSLLGGLFALPPAQAQIRDTGGGEVVRVTDRVYVATGYALGNVVVVVTDSSRIILDTTESPVAARQVQADLRGALGEEAMDRPVSHVIYSHHHGDHINGTSVFAGAGTEVVAQARHVGAMQRYQTMGPYNARLNALQWGALLPREQQGARLHPSASGHLARLVTGQGAVPGGEENRSGYRPPTQLFEAEAVIEKGGVRLELYHTPGETADHLSVWVPSEGVLAPGDLIYPMFPMLASPMKPARPVQEWAASLEGLREFGARHLVGSHGAPVSGRAVVDARLANYAQAIRHIHDETVERINRGQALDQIRAQVQLPDSLARLPYLQPMYGTVPWGVNGVHRRHTGWYDFEPTHLNPLPDREVARTVLDATDGAARLLDRTWQALREGEPQLVLHLTDVLLAAADVPADVHALRARALERLAETADSEVAVNVYRTAAQQHRRAAADE